MPQLAYDAGTRAVRAVQEFRQAEQECASVIGNTLAMDTASEVYEAALTALGVSTKDLRGMGVPTLRAAFLANRRGGARPVAMDAAASKARAERFPNGNRMK